MPSAFLDAGAAPGDRELANTLGGAAALWNALRERLGREHAGLRERWVFSGKSHGWLWKIESGRKALVYLIPNEGSFVASFALREAACTAALAARLPARVQQSLREARTFAEGRALKLEVRARGDLDAVATLVALQLEA